MIKLTDWQPLYRVDVRDQRGPATNVGSGTVDVRLTGPDDVTATRTFSDDVVYADPRPLTDWLASVVGELFYVDQTDDQTVWTGR